MLIEMNYNMTIFISVGIIFPAVSPVSCLIFPYSFPVSLRRELADISATIFKTRAYISAWLPNPMDKPTNACFLPVNCLINREIKLCGLRTQAPSKFSAPFKFSPL